ncbi:MAG: PDZ domain-containing protein, partial [Candidatus Eremiobacteraeota bacterium]|nr:PDZ domain-containing protein [Candidatus Eremiobacteraeota bacterium]
MDTGYYRYPTVSAERIAFVSEDDLWLAPLAGGVARRLTTSLSDVALPRFSPDRKTLTFVARDEGHPEVYVMPSEGGNARRLTFLGGGVCTVSGWSPGGDEVLFTSDYGSPFERETQGFAVSIDGGAPRALGLGHATTLAAAPGGVLAIGRNSADPARWKRYRGGTAGDIWVDASGAGTFERLISLKGNVVWPMWVAGRIFFLSDHEGVGNIYSTRPDGSDLRRHTDEREYFARFPSSDGTRIVYTAGAQLRCLDAQDGSVRTIEVSTPSTAPQTARRFEEASEHVEHFAPSPDGTQIALISRGQPYGMPLWEEAVTHYGNGSKVRYRLLEWLRDNKQLVFVDDEPGYERIVLAQSDQSEEPRAITKQPVGRIVELTVSPSDDEIAFTNHRHELFVIDASPGSTPRKLDESPGERISRLAFSPDGRYLAYAWSPAHDVSIVRICKVKSGQTNDVTSPLRIDTMPVWDPEGNYLYFLSTRDFNPVYDALQFDLSFPQAMRPFAVALRKDVRSPFVPKPQPLHKEHRDDDEIGKKPKVPKIEIDFEGISGRVIGFPVEEGRYEEIVAVKGRALFTRFPVKGIKPLPRSWDEESRSGTLHAYDFDSQRLVTFAREVEDMRLAADFRTLVYGSNDRLRAIDAGGELPDDDDDEHKLGQEPGRRSGWIDLRRISVEIEPRDEWAQMYREAWRLQREQFWDERMSGVDWDVVFERYARLLPLIRTRGELSDLIWEMHGELGTSHAYEIGGDYRPTPQYRRGFLGADLRWDDSLEGWRIEKIYRGDSWDREFDSPLAAAGLDVEEGDAILAVGGHRVARTRTVDELLINAADREVTLTVASKKGEKRRVMVKALASDRLLRYRAWVTTNRDYVHRRTNGEVGYLHIPDMGPWGFSEFHRGYLSEFNRGGLIVDVRYNRGGHVSPLLLEKLARKRIGYDVMRWGPPVPYPPESVGGPMVALTNQFAGSDGDIFSHAFKLYKLGPLIGKRTWGGVIGINPAHALVDGTITTQPEFSFWFVDVGWGVENYGTDPDYDIDVAPHDARAGRDPQMEKALELIASLRAAADGKLKPNFE